MNPLSVAKSCIFETWHHIRSKLYPLDAQLSGKEIEYLKQLREDGYVTIPNYWSEKNCSAMKTKLERYLYNKKNKDFSSGAYIRFWDDRRHDQGVRRLYHVDREIPELKKLRFDPFITRIANGYYGFPFYSGALVFQHNTRTNYETREYHADAFTPEFKAFLYLEKVTEGNGPFTYIRSSQNAVFLRFKKELLGNKRGSPTSFYEKDVKSLLKNEVKITGNAGTLILADVRGIHRGSPQKDKSRSVLVNYMFPVPGDVELDK